MFLGRQRHRPEQNEIDQEMTSRMTDRDVQLQVELGLLYEFTVAIERSA